MTSKCRATSSYDRGLMMLQWYWEKVSTVLNKLGIAHVEIAVANFAAYTFAPPIMVTPIGCLSVLIGCVMR